MSPNVMLRDTSLPTIQPTDGRQLEIVAAGLSFARGAPLGCDVTMVSPLHATGQPWPNAATRNGVAIARGEKDKQDTYPELVNSPHCHLVILACETGGRWSQTCLRLIKHLATTKAQSAPSRLQGSARFAWSARWWSMLSVAAQTTLASSLLDVISPTYDGIDGTEPPLSDVLLAADAADDNDASRLPLR